MIFSVPSSFFFRYEDNLAVIFMGIVLFFLISHLPRMLMGIHEVVVHRQTRYTWLLSSNVTNTSHFLLFCRACEEARRRPWALWVHLVTAFSHLLLVINGSVNSLIYCVLSSRFRAQVHND